MLAGGKGTRLATQLKDIPKPMVSIGGRPFLEILIKRLAKGGCKRVILSVGYLESVIRNHFGAKFDQTKIDYVVEAEPLGTGGAIKRALQEARERDVLVLNGDTVLDVTYSALLEAHLLQNSTLTVTVVKHPDLSDTAASELTATESSRS